MLDRIVFGHSPASCSTWKYVILRTQVIYIKRVIHCSGKIPENEKGVAGVWYSCHATQKSFATKINK